MGTLSVRFPNSVHNAIKKAAKADDISINQFVTSAVIEKLTALNTEDIIATRAKRGSREKYLAVLNKVPDDIPADEDEFVEE